MSQSPGRGQTVEEKTSVDFVVSKGKKDETIPVPEIIGMSEADAIAQIQSAGLSYRTDRVYSNSTSAGLVDDVYPAAGTKLTKGSTVEIYISRGAESNGGTDHGSDRGTDGAHGTVFRRRGESSRPAGAVTWRKQERL